MQLTQLPIVIIFFLIGLLFVKLTTSDDATIMYPTIDNYKDLLYIDESNVCYKYKLYEIEC